VTRSELGRIAILAQSGVARCVVPANSSTDGDLVFASTTRDPGGAGAPDDAGARADTIGVAAAAAVVGAVLSAVAPR
jgi:L-aminopeptidase/D-esterase-like protein